MAALLHGEAPPFVRPAKTFASVLSQSPSSASSGVGLLNTYKGEPSLVISRQDMLQIAAPYSNALVGRFAVGRPSMELIRKFIVSLGLRGECPIVSYVSVEMVNFPGLPLPFFEKQFLLKLGTLLGRPLKVDEATASLKRPSVARILLEVDVLQPPKSRIWIGDDQWGFWQKIEYEDYPSYCGFCSLIGHTEAICHRKHPELRPVRSGPSFKTHVRQVFQPKGVSAVDDSLPVAGSGVVEVPGIQAPDAPVAPEATADLPPQSANPSQGNFPQATVLVHVPVLSNTSLGADEDTHNLLALGRQVSSSPFQELSDDILISDGDNRGLLIATVSEGPNHERHSSSLSPMRNHDRVRLVRSSSEGRSGGRGISLVELKSFQDRLPSRIKASKLCYDPVGGCLDDTDSQLLQKLIQGHKGRPRQSRKREAVYAKCNRIGRRRLWEALEHFSMSVTLPWIAVGDYNVITCAEERIGGSSPNMRDLEEFNSALHRSGLFPVQFDGSAYTWANGRMWQRLDRAVVNAAWLADVEMTRVAHLQRGRSDHCPLLVKWGSTSTRRSSFRFLNVWRGHSSFQQTVKLAWSQSVSGVGMQKFFNKLQVVKRALSRWNVEVFGNVSQRVKQAADNLLAKEILYDQNRDMVSRTAVHEARAFHSRELALECEFWRQKAAIKWIKEGDANTFFFHAAVKQKRSCNFIARIRGSGDSWFDSIEDIKLSASDFFSTLFTADRAAGSGIRPSLELPKLTTEENDCC
ncbi:uncharacterized protein [Coffea arabica]|uniref:DUF4283 domain-containing protein n=1 Tax=Coffea arabica TaxID=13443 RepID=A0ABM4W308_COFAR